MKRRRANPPLKPSEAAALRAILARHGYRVNARPNENQIPTVRVKRNPRISKTELLYVVQGDYGQGWEDLAASLSWTEARNDIRAYRENEGGNYRLIQRRVKKDTNPKPRKKKTKSKKTKSRKGKSTWKNRAALLRHLKKIRVKALRVAKKRKAHRRYHPLSRPRSRR
jgi:hypothetical protein